MRVDERENAMSLGMRWRVGSKHPHYGECVGYRFSNGESSRLFIDANGVVTDMPIGKAEEEDHSVCDCYSTKCEFCDNMVEIHIGDYSTERSNVKVICHECVSEGNTIDYDCYEYPDRIERADQVWWKDNATGDTVDVGIIGAVVKIYCTDKNGYNISLN